MNKETIAIIQARMSSSRLPGKTLKPLAGQPMIWHIYNRVQHCKLVDKIIVATSDHPSDDTLADYCEKKGIRIYRGSLDNVLSRYLAVLNKEKSSYYVRITGDCPLIHPPMIDNQIKALTAFNADAVWCPNPGSAFEGQGVHSARSLFHIAEHSDSLDDQEHVGSLYLANNPGKFRIVEMSLPEELIVEHIRLTIDEEDDYAMLSKLYEKLWPSKKWIELRAALAWLTKRQDIASLNKNIIHKKLNIELQEKKKSWVEISKVGNWKYDSTL
jgi:spore coat polysaccharide biosynthesis protein SpsF